MVPLITVSRKRHDAIAKCLEEGQVNYKITPDESQPEAGFSVHVDESQADRAMSLVQQLIADTGSDGIILEGGVKKYRKILVPVDFTSYSENACYVAIGLAARLKAEIELLHAYFVPDLTTMPFDESITFQGTMAEYMKETRERAREQMEEFTLRMRQYVENSRIKGVEIGYSLLRGLPSDAVLYMNETMNPDVIVMGTRSLEKRKEEGGAVVSILREARVPVLVVPESSNSGGLDTIHNIAYATDFDESDFASIRKLFGLIAPFNLKLFCIHIGAQQAGEEQKNKMNGLREYFRSAYKDFDVECLLVEHHDVIAGLDEAIKEKSIDVIALTTRRRNLITSILNPSLTRKLFFHTNIPLLVFHS